MKLSIPRGSKILVIDAVFSDLKNVISAVSKSIVDTIDVS